MKKAAQRKAYYQNYQAPESMTTGVHIRVNDELAALALKKRAAAREQAELAERAGAQPRKWWTRKSFGFTRPAV